MGQFRRVRKNWHKEEGGERGGEIRPEREGKRTEVGGGGGGLWVLLGSVVRSGFRFVV